MVHEIEQIGDTEHKRMEVPGGWIYMIYDYRLSSTVDGREDWGYELVSSVFVPKIK